MVGWKCFKFCLILVYGSSKVRSPKMLLEQDRFSKVSELSPGLVFATESVSELFKLTYPNLFKNILGYLNPVTFSVLSYCQTDSLCYLE